MALPLAKKDLCTACVTSQRITSRIARSSVGRVFDMRLHIAARQLCPSCPSHPPQFPPTPLGRAFHLGRATATDSPCGCMPHYGAPEESCARPRPALAHEATTAGTRSMEASRGACPQECPENVETRCEMYSCSKVVLQSTSCCRRRLCPECTLRCSQRRLGPAELRSQSGAEISTTAAVADFRCPFCRNMRPLSEREVCMQAMMKVIAPVFYAGE